MSILKSLKGQTRRLQQRLWTACGQPKSRTVCAQAHLGQGHEVNGMHAHPQNTSTTSSVSAEIFLKGAGQTSGMHRFLAGAYQVITQGLHRGLHDHILHCHHLFLDGLFLHFTEQLQKTVAKKQTMKQK